MQEDDAPKDGTYFARHVGPFVAHSTRHLVDARKPPVPRPVRGPAAPYEGR